MALLTYVAACGGEGDQDFESGSVTSGGDAAAPTPEVALVTTRKALEPGTTVDVGIRFELPRPWHLYWNGRNDTGLPPTVEWDLPPDFVVGPLRWPVPQRHVSPGDILDHVYFDELLLIGRLTVPTDLADGDEVTLKADVRWLACAKVCVPGRRSLALTLPVVARGGSDPADEPTFAAFARARARWAQPVASRAEALRWSWRETTLDLRWEGAERLVFYPDEDGVELVDPLHDAAAAGDRLRLRASFAEDRQTSGVSGVLAVHRAGDEPVLYRKLFIPGPDVPMGSVTE